MFANGWGRNHRTHHLADKDFLNAATRASAITIGGDTQVSMVRDDNILRICFGVSDVSLNGNYAVTMELEEQEVARLFMQQYAGCDLATVVKAIGEIKTVAA